MQHEPEEVYEDYLSAVYFQQLPPGFPPQPAPVSATFTGSNAEYKLWMKKKVARDEWEDALKVYLKKQADGNTEVLQGIIARLNATNEDLKAAEMAMAAGLPPQPPIQALHPSPAGNNMGAAPPPGARPAFKKEKSNPPDNKPPRRPSMKATSNPSIGKSFSRVTGFLRSPTGGAGPSNSQIAQNSVPMSATDAPAAPVTKPMTFNTILQDEKISKQQPIPAGFPAPPPSIGKFEGKTQQDYKDWMQRRLIQEEWTNALILYRIKETNGDTEAMKRIVQRLRESMATVARIEKKNSQLRLMVASGKENPQDPAGNPAEVPQRAHKISYFANQPQQQQNPPPVVQSILPPGSAPYKGPMGVPRGGPGFIQRGGQGPHIPNRAPGQPQGHPIPNFPPPQQMQGPLSQATQLSPTGQPLPHFPQGVPHIPQPQFQTSSTQGQPLLSPRVNQPTSPHFPPPQNQNNPSFPPPMTSPQTVSLKPIAMAPHRPGPKSPQAASPPQNSSYNNPAFNAFSEVEFSNPSGGTPRDQGPSPRPPAEAPKLEALETLIQDMALRPATEGPVPRLSSRQPQPKRVNAHELYSQNTERLNGLAPVVPKRISLRVVRQPQEEEFDLSQLDMLSNVPLPTDDPNSPFFDLNSFQVEQTNDNDWLNWATSTLESASKDNIQIKETPSFEVIQEEIDQALIQDALDDLGEFGDDMTEGIVVDFSDLLF